MRQESPATNVSDTVMIQPLKVHSQYKLLGILKNQFQREKGTLECTRDLSVDHLRVSKLPVNPLRLRIKLQILLLCFHTFLAEVMGRNC